MQWSAARNAGFTQAEPWLPVAEDYAQMNVAVERADPASILALYRDLIALRRGEPALEVGRFEMVDSDGDVLAYVRRDGHGAFLVALNFGASPQMLRLPAHASAGTIARSTYLDRAGEQVDGRLSLRADEGLLVRLD